MRRLISWTLGGLCLLVVVLLLVLAFPPTGLIADKLESLVAERTGYALDIGDLDLDLLSDTPSATVSSVSIDGAALPGLLDVGRAEVAVDLGAALGGDLVIERLLLEGGEVALVRRADGTTSWAAGEVATTEPEPEPDAADEASFELPAIRELSVADLEIAWDDEVSDTRARFAVQAAGSTLDGEDPLIVSAVGSANDLPVQATMQLRSPLGDAVSGDAVRLTLDATAPGLGVVFDASAADALRPLDALELDVEADVESLAAIQDAFAVTLPPMAPATIAADVAIAGATVNAAVEGTTRGEPIEAAIAVALESPLADGVSLDGSAVLDLTATVGGASLVLGGRVGELDTLGDAELALQADVDSLDALESLLGTDLPDIGSADASITVTSEPDGSGFTARATGSVDGERIDASVDIDSALRDIAAGEPATLAVDASVGGSSVSASGSVENLRTLEGVDLDLDVDVESLDALGRLTGIEMPPLDSASLSTTVRTDAERTTLLANGTIDGAPVQATLTLDTAVDGLLAGDPVTLDLDAAVGGVAVEAEGRIGDLATLADTDVSLQLDVESLAAVESLLGTELPPLAPATLSGTVRRDGDTFIVRRFDLAVADSTLEGDVRFDPSTTPPTVYANLIAPRLDIDAVLAALGLDPEPPDVDVAIVDDGDIEQHAMLPTEALPFEIVFDSVQGAVELRIDALSFDQLPMDSLDVRATFAPARATLDIADFAVAGGDVVGRVELDAMDGGRAVDAKLDLELSRLRLGPFVPTIELLDDLGGPVGGRVELWASGDSVADLAGTLDGGVLLLMGEGRLDEALVELAGIDVFQAIGDLVNPGEDEFRMRCAYASLQAREGVITLSDFVIDSADTVFLAAGTVDAAAETLDVRLEPHPKDPSLLAASTTVTLGGTFAEIEVGVDEGLPVRAAASAALALVATPAAALLPFIEIGGGEDSAFCQLEGALDGDAG